MNTTMTRAETVCGTVLLLFLALGVWGILIAAGSLPAAPWSPIGQANQHAHHQAHHAPPTTTSRNT